MHRRRTIDGWTRRRGRTSSQRGGDRLRVAGAAERVAGARRDVVAVAAAGGTSMTTPKALKAHQLFATSGASAVTARPRSCRPDAKPSELCDAWPLQLADAEPCALSPQARVFQPCGISTPRAASNGRTATYLRMVSPLSGQLKAVLASSGSPAHGRLNARAQQTAPLQPSATARPGVGCCTIVGCRADGAGRRPEPHRGASGSEGVHDNRCPW